MSIIADTRNNPFQIDDSTTPPQRSALAVLEVERDELREIGVEAAFERARRRLGADSGLSSVYGRSLTEDDLRMAVTRLGNPRDRVVNELLDYRHEVFQIGELPELREVLEAFRAVLASQEGPRVEDPSLIAAMLVDRVVLPRLEELPALATAVPARPSLEDLLRD
ncbi:MAG: hypothetical protein H6807_10100 [Planctomycetes bacterium]|nr:hypothetical protein [Planctomycetota bacterium]